MNILPLILALVLMLSVLTVERLEKFKNQTVVQREYQVFLKEGERQMFNKRQKTLYGINQKDICQLSFRYFVNKKTRERSETKQYRMLNIELMKVLYSEAAFFKNLEKKRPNFLEELLNAVEKAADAAPERTIKRIQDIARLNLDDSELQEAFYHMLKGTISREKLKEMKELSPSMKEKAYVSLLSFINYNGTDGTPKIMVQHSPREILKAIFVSDEIVEAIIARRKELAASKDNGASMAFESEFKDKRRPGLDNTLLDFKITGKTDLSVYD